MRLFDEMVAAGRIKPSRNPNDCPVYDLTNVAAYMWLAEQETWDYDQLPPSLPPHRQMWAEWRNPDQMTTEIDGRFERRPSLLDQAGGCMLWTFDAREIGLERAIASTYMPDEPESFRNDLRSQGRASAKLWSDIGWVVLMDGWTKSRDDGVVIPFCRIRLLINNNGVPNGYWIGDPNDGILRQLRSMDMSLNVVKYFFLTPLLGFSFCHCKNVTERINAPSRALNKARLGRGRAPLVAYRTLEIEPMAARGSGGGARGSHVPPSMHIRRGHFRTYTREKPLFGRHHGTWWWDSIVVASGADGRVQKDYTVHSPKSA